MGVPLVMGDRVLVQSTTTGTGSYQLGPAMPGFLTPAQAGIASGSRVPYIAVDSLTAPTLFEVGEGVYASGSPPTLTRALVRENADGATAAVSWMVGTRYIFLAPNAASLPLLDTDGKIPRSFLAPLPTAWSGTWSGTFDLSTAPTEFIAINVPNGVKAIVGGLSARGENQAASLATVAVDVILRTAAGTIVQQFADASAVAGNNLPRYWQIGGPFAFSTAADAGFQGLSLAVRARKDLAIGPFNVNQIVAGLAWLYG